MALMPQPPPLPATYSYALAPLRHAHFINLGLYQCRGVEPLAFLRNTAASDLSREEIELARVAEKVGPGNVDKGGEGRNEVRLKNPQKYTGSDGEARKQQATYFISFPDGFVTQEDTEKPDCDRVIDGSARTSDSRYLKRGAEDTPLNAGKYSSETSIQNVGLVNRIGTGNLDEKENRDSCVEPFGIKEEQSEYSDEATNVETADIDEVVEPITRIPVPRQKYISVSKFSLVKALADAFDDNKKAAEFLIICSYLDYILHAEHKATLEQLRVDYKVTCSAAKTEAQPQITPEKSRRMQKTGWIKHITEARRKSLDHNKEAIPSDNGSLFSYHGKAEQMASTTVTVSSNNGAMCLLPRSKENGTLRNSSVAAAARFQRNFLKLIRNAKFQGLSARDLQLTSSLNTDYLLTLPIVVDWKRTSLENTIVFRRGYASEKQEGLLFGAKLDFLQSIVLLKTFDLLSKPLFHAGTWITQRWNAFEKKNGWKGWLESFKEWLKEPLMPDLDDDLSGVMVEASFNQEAEDLPMWIAAQRAVPRYEAFLSSVGSRGMLLRKILIWMRILPPRQQNKSAGLQSELSIVETSLRGSYLSRISMRDIWLPASRAAGGVNPWQRIQTAFKIFFSQSTLQEPAFHELVLLYNARNESKLVDGRLSMPDLRLKVYGKIPLPDLKVIFPNKKLSFRILDTVRLDVATIIGLLAFLLNYRFDDFLSSPSAFFLDIIATSALVVYITRVFLGYKQTYDRYQLLVNKTLHEKTLASEFGAVHFLVDASQQQQFKEAILAFAMLLQVKGGQVESLEALAGRCEHFLSSNYSEQVEMPVDDALATLTRLGVVVHSSKCKNDQQNSCIFEAVPHEKLMSVLQNRWKDLVNDQSLWFDFLQLIHDKSIC